MYLLFHILDRYVELACLPRDEEGFFYPSSPARQRVTTDTIENHLLWKASPLSSNIRLD